MSNLIIDYFKEPPAKEVIQDKQKIDKLYKHWSWRIFVSVYIAYIVTHFCRKNISVALPFIGQDLGYSNTQLGILGASLYLTYGIGKFCNGILADRCNVRTFLPTAMILSAIANICFAYSTVFVTPNQVSFFGLPSATILLWVLAFFWGANGWFQSMVYPPIVKSLSYWIPKSERATKCSLWTTSHQFGICLSIMATGFLIGHVGWKTTFGIEAIFVTIVSLFLFWALKDRPQSMGLPDVDVYKNETTEQKNDEEKTPYFEMFKKYILKNKTLWLLALTFLCVNVIRFGTEDWFVKYLMEYKNNTLTIATAKLTTLAVVGSIGAVFAGWLSDKTNTENRIPINIYFFIGLGISVFLFHVNTFEPLDYVYASLIGAFSAAILILIGGVCALEATSKKVSSAALGFTGMFGYIGAVISSSGTGFMIDYFQAKMNNGWYGAISFWIISVIIGILICLVLMYHNSQNQKKGQFHE